MKDPSLGVESPISLLVRGFKSVGHPIIIIEHSTIGTKHLKANFFIGDETPVRSRRVVDGWYVQY